MFTDHLPRRRTCKHPDEKTLYLAGNTIWNQHLQESLKAHQPDVVVLNCGAAEVTGLGAISMDKQDVFRCLRPRRRRLSWAFIWRQ